MLDPQMVAYLKTVTPYNTLVSGRIYPDRLPDPPVLPATVYQRVSAPRDAAYDGPLGFNWSRYQFDTWALTRAEARSVARELSRAMLGFSGMMGVTHVAIPSQPQDIDMYETETGYYRVMSEYIIWHTDDDLPEPDPEPDPEPGDGDGDGDGDGNDDE